MNSKSVTKLNDVLKKIIIYNAMKCIKMAETTHRKSAPMIPSKVFFGEIP
jgi:hypothetical protein